MFDCCLVSSLSLMVFYNILLPMFSASRSPASLLLVCVPPRPTAAWLLLRSVVPYHSLFLLLLLRPSRQVRLLFLSTSLLSLGYPSPTPPSLFLAGYFDAQVSGFRYPSPAPPRLFLTGYFDAQVSLFRYPRAFFSLPVLVSLIACFDALLFSHPTFPSRLLGWPARSLCRLAVRLRFLPLRGFYRSAFAGFLGALLFRRPHACCPPVFTHFRAARSCAALRFACDFYRSAVFTAQRFFTAPRFLSLCFRRFLGALLFRHPHACCPPVFTHFRAARSCAALRFACDFYRSAVFTAPRFLPLSGFLPLRGFYRSAFAGFWGLCSSATLMLAAPQSSPTSGRLALCAALRYACDFYRSAVFTAPRFLPLRFRRFFGGSALPPPSCLLPPSLRPLPGAPCGAGSSVASPVGRHS